MFASPRTGRAAGDVAVVRVRRSRAPSTPSIGALLIGVPAALLVAPWPVALAGLVACPPAALAARRHHRPDRFGRSVVPFAPAPLSFLAIAALLVGVAIAPYLVEPVRPRGLLLLAQFALLPLVAGAFVLVPRSAAAIRSIRHGVTAAAFAAGAVAVVQVVPAGLPRAEGWTSNAIVFGDLALVLALLVVVLRPGSDTDRRADVAVLASGAALVAAVLSGTRSVALAAPILAGIAVWGRRPSWEPVRLAWMSAGTTLIVLVGNAVSGGVPLHRLRLAIGDTVAYAGAGPHDPSAATSIGARLEAWRAAAWAFRHEPLSGVGWGNLPMSFREQVGAGRRNPRIETFDHAHHQLLSSLANGGLAGGATLLALLAVPAYWFVVAAVSGDDDDRRLGTAGLVVVAGYTVFGTTEAIFENFVPVAFYAVTVAALLSQLTPQDRPRRIGGATASGSADADQLAVVDPV